MKSNWILIVQSISGPRRIGAIGRHIGNACHLPARSLDDENFHGGDVAQVDIGTKPVNEYLLLMTERSLKNDLFRPARCLGKRSETFLAGVPLGIHDPHTLAYFHGLHDDLVHSAGKLALEDGHQILKPCLRRPLLTAHFAENTEAATGCTVLLFGKDGAPAGLDVRGGGPASRESELLKPMAAAQIIHAILLSGGSAFGLDAAGGVQKYLEERGIGFDVGVTKVPLVCQSDLFDLTVGRMDVRPDAAMGYAACLGAEHNNYRDGNYGAGTGASVGKMTGMGTCMKSGIGSYAVQLGDLKVGAIVAVNSLGDIYNWRDGHKVAGMLTPDCKHFVDSEDVVFADYEVVENKFVGNTTIGVVLTNAAFQKTQLCKLAGMAHDGYARSIRPVHTSADGDSIYAVSLGKLAADQDVVGALGARVMSEAILRAVQSADAAYGLPCAKDFQ